MRVDVVGDSTAYCFGTTMSSEPMFYWTGFGFMVLTDDVKDRIYLESKDILTDSVKDANGERECYHVYLSGSAIAIPANIHSVSNEDIKVCRNAKAPTRTVPHHYLNTMSGTESWYGPIFHAGDPVDYSFNLPDFYDQFSVNQVKDGVLSITSQGKYAYLMVSECKWRRYPNDSWKDFRYEQLVEFDSALKMWRTNNGTWKPAKQLVKRTGPSLPYTGNGLPSTKRDYETALGILRNKFQTYNSSNVFGDLARRCANDARVVPCNTIELLSELADIKQTLLAVYNLTKGKVDAKKIASAYLQYKYGLRLTVHDLKAMAKGITKRLLRISLATSRARAREVLYYPPKDSRSGSCVVQYNYKIIHYIESKDWRDILRNWFDSGLFPSLTNAWDLIPLSFVVDWFIPVEGHLNAIDSNTYWSTYEIAGVIFSEKTTYQDVGWLFEESGWSLTGNVRLVEYNRQRRSQIHLPLFFDPSPRDFHNYAELSSLFIAKWR